MLHKPLPLSKAAAGARALIKHGLPVIPLKPKSKTPAEKGWQHKHIKTTGKLKAYLKAHSSANFGVVTGDDVIIVDVDGKKGKRALKKLEHKYGALPETVTVITPGGGEHRYFYARGVEIGNSASKLGPNIDVRGSGGFVVAAGSTHPNGGRYRYAKGKALGEVEIALLPKWPRKKLKKAKVTSAPFIEVLTGKQTARGKRYAQRALEREAMRVCNAPFHTRNNTLNRASFRIGQLLAHQLVGEAEAMSLLTQAAIKCGLAATEAMATIQSGINSGKKWPRRLPPGLLEDPPAQRGSSIELTRELARLGQTDADNAERFIRRYGHRVLWTKAKGWAVLCVVRTIGTVEGVV